MNRWVLIILLSAFPTATLGQVLELPARGVWNGYLNQTNVIECSNAGTTAIALDISVQSNSGSELGTFALELGARATGHVVLNQLPLENQYGTYVLSRRSGPSTELLTCQTAFYRMTQAGEPKAVEYAYVIPAGGELNGPSYGVYNSFDPGVGRRPVVNYLSVYNSGSTPFSAQVNLYLQNGELDAEHSFSITGLASGERQDFALGHEQGERVGLYEIIPTSPTAAYGAFVMRYGTKADEQFNFAFPLFAQAGSCALAPVHASIFGNALNWGEIANPTDSEILARVELRDQSGALLYEEPQLAIPAHAQAHLPLHQYLQQSFLGQLSIQCLGEPQLNERLLLTSAFYGHLPNDTLNVEWSYASQAQAQIAGADDAALAQINTYLVAPNWTKLLENNGQSITIATRIYDGWGTLRFQQSLALASGGTLDIGSHPILGFDAVGLGILEPKTDGAGVAPGTIRVYPHAASDIGYIMNVPARIVPAAGIGDDDDPPLPPPPPEQYASSIAQHGITWTFDAQYKVGQYATGDWWVVGPIVVTGISPQPSCGDDVGRNGSQVNPRFGKGGYDGRTGASYDESLCRVPPLSLSAGDTLVSVSSYSVYTNKTYVESGAVLTVVDVPQPARSFRPPYARPTRVAVSASDELRFNEVHIEWDRLLKLAPVADTPSIDELVNRWFSRPWIEHYEGWQGTEMMPYLNMPNYGREWGQIQSDASLLLLLNYSNEQKKPLLVGMIQLGIDLYGSLIDGGEWENDGGIFQGRKWPQIFAGVMLDYPGMRNIGFSHYSYQREDGQTRHFFAEDGQTYYFNDPELPVAADRDGFACTLGQAGCYPVRGERGWVDRYNGGPGDTVLWRITEGGDYGYATNSHEHMPVSAWHPDDSVAGGRKSEAYRRCCTSISFIGYALAARLMGAIHDWNHPAFFDYSDRWMEQEDTAQYNENMSLYPESDWNPFRQQTTLSDFVDTMWATYR